MSEAHTTQPTDRARPTAPGPVGRLLSVLARLLGLADGRCSCCSRLVNGTILCADCAARLAPRTTGFCPHCGMIFENAHQTPMRCGACSLSPRPWDRVIFHGVHEDLLRELIIQWKYGRSPVRAGLLEQLAADTLVRHRQGAVQRPGQSYPAEKPECTAVSGCARRDNAGHAPPGNNAMTPVPHGGQEDCREAPPSWDAVVPVPLHPRRLRWRGFNQSQELARAAARRIGAELLHRALERTRETIPQTELSGSERKENIKDAFYAESGQIAGKRLLLVDDVLTTGATLEECARTLKRAGAASVDVLVLARARGG